MSVYRNSFPKEICGTKSTYITRPYRCNIALSAAFAGCAIDIKYIACTRIHAYIYIHTNRCISGSIYIQIQLSREHENLWKPRIRKFSSPRAIQNKSFFLGRGPIAQLYSYILFIMHPRSNFHKLPKESHTHTSLSLFWTAATSKFNP